MKNSFGGTTFLMFAIKKTNEENMVTKTSYNIGQNWSDVVLNKGSPSMLIVGGGHQIWLTGALKEPDLFHAQVQRIYIAPHFDVTATSLGVPK